MPSPSGARTPSFWSGRRPAPRRDLVRQPVPVDTTRGSGAGPGGGRRRARAALQARLRCASRHPDSGDGRRRTTVPRSRGRQIPGTVRERRSATAAASAAESTRAAPELTSESQSPASAGRVLALRGGDRMGALAATVFANFALARPAAVEVALEQFAAVERAHPVGGPGATGVRRRGAGSPWSWTSHGSVAAVTRVMAEEAPRLRSSRLISLPKLWEGLTGRRLAAVPRSVGSPLDRPGRDALTRLSACSPRVCPAGGPRPRQLVPGGRRRRAGRQCADESWPPPGRQPVPPGRQQRLCRSLTADRRSLCRRALDDLAPYRIKFVVLGTPSRSALLPGTRPGH